MKKKLALVLALVMAFSMLFALTACTKTPEEQLAEAFKKLENDNAKMTFSIKTSGITVTFEMNVDGNVMKLNIMEQEIYVEIDENTGKASFYVADDDGSYSKTEGDLEDLIGLDTESEEMDVFLTAENYTYSEEDEMFIFNEDKLPETEEDFTGATIVLNEDGSFVLAFTAEIDGIAAEISITFSHFGEIELTLPTVA